MKSFLTIGDSSPDSDFPLLRIPLLAHPDLVRQSLSSIKPRIFYNRSGGFLRVLLVSVKAGMAYNEIPNENIC
jgi:hypothetical protein